MSIQSSTIIRTFLALLVIAIVGVLLWYAASQPRQNGTPSESPDTPLVPLEQDDGTQPSDEPAFLSDVQPSLTGDRLWGWTIDWVRPAEPGSAPMFSGTQTVQRLHVISPSKTASLVIEEFVFTDRDAFLAQTSEMSWPPVTLLSDSDRAAYLVPDAGLVPASALLIFGTERGITVSHPESPAWPVKLNDETYTFLHSLIVP